MAPVCQIGLKRSVACAALSCPGHWRGAVRASLGIHVTSTLTRVVAAAGCWLVACIIVHLDLIVLRLRLRQHARPFRSPAFPLPQVLGILGMGYVFLNISPTPELAAPIYKNVAVIRGVPSAYSLVCTVLVMRRNPSDRIWLVRCKMAPSTMTEVARMTGKAGMTGEGVNPAPGKGMYPSLRKSCPVCIPINTVFLVPREATQPLDSA